MIDPFRQAGVTLVELVLSIVILAIALVGITQMISGGIRRSADVTLELRAVELAQAYLEEIAGRRFDEASSPRGIPPCNSGSTDVCTEEANFGPEAGEGRVGYDDVDDYHGLDEGDEQAGPLRDAEGYEREGYDNFRVQVNVRYIQPGAGGEEETLAGDAGSPQDEQDAKLITVTVSHRSQPAGYDFSVYKANF